MTAQRQQKLLESFTAEQKAEVERQIKQMLELGYKREHLWITPNGNVLFDPEEATYDIFHESQKQNNNPDQ